MAIDYANLFSTVGKIGKFQLAINTQQDAWDDKIEEIADAQDDAIARDAISDLLTASTLQSAREGVAEIYPKLQAAAEATVIAYVKADQPSKASSITTALEELRRQMVVSSESVKAATVSVTAAALTTNSGNGAIVTTTKRGDGKTQELIVAEVGFLTCTADSQTGGATIAQETFTFTGEDDDGDESAFNWPTGSGATATVTVIDPTQDNAGGNVLTNSDFDTWAGSPLSPTGWIIAGAGVFGTDIVRTTTIHDAPTGGTYGLSFVGDGSTLSGIKQLFDNATGTLGELLPSRSYAVNFWGKFSATPSTGIITVSLVDGSGTVVADDAGTNNTQTFDTTGWSTSFVAKNVVFRTPKLVPTTCYLQVKVTTAIENGKTVYIDQLAMGLTEPLYDGGPSVAIFPGATKWVSGDGWTLTMANNRGGASFAASFNALFDRFFDMRSKLQMLPTDASPTRADTLISS